MARTWTQLGQEAAEAWSGPVDPETHLPTRLDVDTAERVFAALFAARNAIVVTCPSS